MYEGKLNVKPNPEALDLEHSFTTSRPERTVLCFFSEEVKQQVASPSFASLRMSEYLSLFRQLDLSTHVELSRLDRRRLLRLSTAE